MRTYVRKTQRASASRDVRIGGSPGIAWKVMSSCSEGVRTVSHEPGAIHQEEGKVKCIRQSERRTACWIRTQAVHTAKHGSRDTINTLFFYVCSKIVCAIFNTIMPIILTYHCNPAHRFTPNQCSAKDQLLHLCYLIIACCMLQQCL